MNVTNSSPRSLGEGDQPLVEGQCGALSALCREACRSDRVPRRMTGLRPVPPFQTMSRSSKRPFGSGILWLEAEVRRVARGMSALDKDPLRTAVPVS